MNADIQWVQLVPRYSSGYDSDKIYLTVRKSLSQKKPKVFLRIGLGICKKLDFNKGDRIGVFFDPNDYMHIKLAKTVSGYRLNHDNSRNTLTLGFSYHLVDLDPTKKELPNVEINTRTKIIDMHLE